jgi:hypothetical protein
MPTWTVRFVCVVSTTTSPSGTVLHVLRLGAATEMGGIETGWIVA